MFCPHCGKEITEGQLFCRHCGGRITETVPNAGGGRRPLGRPGDARFFGRDL